MPDETARVFETDREYIRELAGMRDEAARTLDETDRDIIRELQANVRAPASWIANRLSMAEATVRRRLNRMLDEGLVHPHVVVDLDDVGGIEAMLGIKVSGDACQTADILARQDAVKWATVTAGRFDVLAWLALADARTLARFLASHVHAIPTVRNCEPFVMLRHAKRWHESPPLPA